MKEFNKMLIIIAGIILLVATILFTADNPQQTASSTAVHLKAAHYY